MPSSPTADAEQRAASDPLTSAFVAASAGSGKTKLLTDRLLRLMLAGTPPGKILCLTYTKAAAAEMALRLNARLGAWVVMPDEKLAAELAAIGAPDGEATRAVARKLFGEVLDLPGGMRISTIHAFCQSLLRRFPLEAGLSPHFELADDAEQAGRLREARETVLAAPAAEPAIGILAAETDETCFADIIGQLANDRHDMRRLLRAYTQPEIAAMQKAALDAPEHEHEALLAAHVAWDREPHLEAALRALADQGNASGAKWAINNLTWLAHEAEARALHWVHWVDGHFTKAGTAHTLHGFFGKKLKDEEPGLRQEIGLEHERIGLIEEQRRAAKLATINRALLALAGPIIGDAAAEAALHARLTYSDLVTRTGGLLHDPGTAWILYKLDGGIDHLLLDEVQDTAPAQWEIADALAEEFFSGNSARDVPRSIFAVGDAKQSIFSFQGADLDSFTAYRARFREKARAAEKPWLDGALSVSFRSTAPVLALVDAVFAASPARDGVVGPAETLVHGVSRDGQAGAVTLHRLVVADPTPPPPPWAVPDSYSGAINAKSMLARQIALAIRTRLDGSEILPSRGRPVTPGDFLVLLRRRDAFATAFTAEAKSLGIPVAGLDRMVLTQQQGVSDLMALCDSLILPEDDLAFGQFLASPLGGLSDDSLMHLAIGRHSDGRRPGSPLAAALAARHDEQPDWHAAHALFTGLRNRVDFSTPHALLAEILGPRGGRAALLRRLGAEAAEPVDELLAEALAYAARHPASLQGFLHHLRTAAATIAREAEAQGDVVRIMTVHGAKGLQAPIVILPDTTGALPDRDLVSWLAAPQPPPGQPPVHVPVFCPRAALRSEAIANAKTAMREAARAESNRLLYVALTRAEDELIVHGAQGAKAPPDGCWYQLIQAGFSQLRAEADEHGTMRLATPQTVPPDRAPTTTARAATPPAPMPGWAGAAPDWSAAAPPRETARPEPLAPSRIAEDEPKRAVATSPLGRDAAFPAGQRTREAALAQGRAIHELLQVLPTLPPSARAAAAGHHLTRQNLDPGLATTLLALLDDAALAPLFAAGSRAEVPLAGAVNGIEIAGIVDRLAVTGTGILFADYKTDRTIPAAPADVPPAYLRQMAAYAAILAQIFPSQPVTCLLIFTQAASVLALPPDLLARHAPRLAEPSAA